MVLPKETSGDGPNSPVESDTQSGRIHQVKNTVTCLSPDSLGSARRTSRCSRPSRAELIQEMIEAAQVRERHVDLRQRASAPMVQDGERRVCDSTAARVRVCWITASALISCSRRQVSTA